MKIAIRDPAAARSLMAIFRCAQHGQQLGCARPLHDRQQKALTVSKGDHREVEPKGTGMSAGKTLAGKLLNRRTEIT